MAVPSLGVEKVTLGGVPGGCAWSELESTHYQGLGILDKASASNVTITNTMFALSDTLGGSPPGGFLVDDVSMKITAKEVDGTFKVQFDDEMATIPRKFVLALVPKADEMPPALLDDVDKPTFGEIVALFNGQSVALTSKNAALFGKLGAALGAQPLQEAGEGFYSTGTKADVLISALALQQKLFDKKGLIALTAEDFDGIPLSVAARLIREITTTRLNFEDSIVVLLGRVSEPIRAAIIADLVTPRAHANVHFLARALRARAIGKDDLSAAQLGLIERGIADEFWNESLLEAIFADDVTSFKDKCGLEGDQKPQIDLSQPIPSGVFDSRGLWFGRLPTPLEFAALCGSFEVFKAISGAVATFIDIREGCEDALLEAIVIGGSADIAQWWKEAKLPLAYKGENALIAAIVYHRQQILEGVEGKISTDVELLAALWSFDLDTVVRLLRTQTWGAGKLLVFATLAGCFPVFDLALAVAGPKAQFDENFVVLAALGGSPEIFETVLTQGPDTFPRALIRPGRLNRAMISVLRKRFPEFKASWEDVLLAVDLDNVGFIQDAVDRKDVDQASLAGLGVRAVAAGAAEVAYYIAGGGAADPAWLSASFAGRSAPLCVWCLESVPDLKGTAVVALAVAHGMLSILDRLLAANADPNEPNQRGQTPLAIAIDMHDPRAVKRLLAISSVDVSNPVAVVAAAEAALRLAPPEWSVLEAVIESGRCSEQKSAISETLGERLRRAQADCVEKWLAS